MKDLGPGVVEIMPGVIAGGHCANPKPWTWAELERAEKIKSSDPTSELSYLDEKIQPNFHTYLEEMWEEEQNRPPQKPVEEPRYHRFKPARPYAGCFDCPRWTRKGCINPFEDETLCKEIDERYKEKAE